MIYDIVCTLVGCYYGFGAMMFLLMLETFISLCRTAWNGDYRNGSRLTTGLLLLAFFLAKTHVFMYPVYGDIYHYFNPKPWYQVW